MESIPKPNTFVEISSELLARGYGVRFRATGGSMSPAIRDGDRITVWPAVPAALTPGNVVLYRRLDRLFAHRIVSTDIDTDRLLLRGDASAICDPPVALSQVLGEVVSVTRGRPSAVARALGSLRQITARRIRAGRGLRPWRLSRAHPACAIPDGPRRAA